MPATSPGVDAAAERSQTVREALAMARDAHSGQTRNASGGRPYIDHPVQVAERLAELDRDDDVLAAALLHDVVEDSDKGIDEIGEACGERVAALVRTLTDDEEIEAYEERKREHRGRVEQDGPDALAIYTADKLTNVEMLRDAYAESGEDVAEELKVPLDVKIGVWEEDLAMVERRLDGDADVRDLASRLASQLRELGRARALRTGASRARPGAASAPRTRGR